MNNCSLFIMSCDSYSDVWDFLFDSIKEYWSDCPYSIYLCTETKKYSRDDLNIKIININNKNWGYRLIEGLKIVPTDYVFFLLEDLIPRKKVEQGKLNKCLDYLINNNNVSNVYVSTTGDDVINRTYTDDLFFTEWPRELASNYRLNAAPAFWRKDCLIKFTKKTDNAWIWEVFGTLRILKYSEKVMTIEDDCHILPYTASGALTKGKWEKTFIDQIKGEKPDFDFNVRGIYDGSTFKDVTFIKKISFLIKGFMACGFRVFIYLYNYVIKKDNYSSNRGVYEKD